MHHTSATSMQEPVPLLPRDILLMEILPYCTIEFLFVSKEHHAVAFPLLLFDASVSDRFTPRYLLEYGARHGHLNLVNLVLTYPWLSRCSNVHTTNFDSSTCPTNGDWYHTYYHTAEMIGVAIIRAVWHGHLAVVRRLLQDTRLMGAERCRFLSEALRCTALRGKSEITELLLEDPCIEPSDKANFAMHTAHKRGHTAIVKMLFRHPKTNTHDEGIVHIVNPLFDG